MPRQSKAAPPRHILIVDDAESTRLKLARILRAKIESGEHKRGDVLASATLVRDYNVSTRVALHALDVLAANRYVTRPGDFRPYAVIWQTGGS